MRSFETRGPVYPEDNYIVARTDELTDFIGRLEKGRYVVLFAPRQTGKTTFFHRALEALPHDNARIILGMLADYETPSLNSRRNSKV